MFFSFADHLPLHKHASFMVTLQRVVHRNMFTEVSTRLEDTESDIFSNMGGSVICGFPHLPRDCAFSHLLQCCPDFLIPFSV
jgi:hypothetical protein